MSCALLKKHFISSWALWEDGILHVKKAAAILSNASTKIQNIFAFKKFFYGFAQVNVNCMSVFWRFGVQPPSSIPSNSIHWWCSCPYKSDLCICSFIVRSIMFLNAALPLLKVKEAPFFWRISTASYFPGVLGFGLLGKYPVFLVIISECVHGLSGTRRI